MCISGIYLVRTISSNPGPALFLAHMHIPARQEMLCLINTPPLPPSLRQTTCQPITTPHPPCPRGPATQCPPYSELKTGHWYQARFEFNDGERQPTPPPSSSASAPAPNPATNRAASWCRQISRLPDPEWSVYCVDSRLDLNPAIGGSHDRLQCIPVNTTTFLVGPHNNTPAPAGSRYGNLDFASGCELPVGSGGGGEAIVRMCQTGSGGADIWSPESVVPYVEEVE